MIKIIGLILAAIIAIVLLLAAFKPDNLRVERSIEIKAPPEKIFPFMNSLRSDGFGAWSPYETKDPDMKRTYSGPASGKGAIYEWQGDSNVGQGRMEIVDTSLPNSVRMKLDFISPMEGHNVVDFVMTPNGQNTHVAWIMDGPSPYLSKVASVFLNMDKMIGGDFEVGLANLKTLAEK